MRTAKVDMLGTRELFLKKNYLFVRFFQEDGNGEKLTVKKMVEFWCRFFHGLVPIFSRFTPIFHGL